MSLLQFRANFLAKTRAFFQQRAILEVETPLLSGSTITDPNLHSFSTIYHPPGANKGQTLYLQTSPEFAMKRLLAAGSGSIFQICKAFRDQEAGHLHRPEFTMLEWYHLGFNHHDLMDEMDEFLNYLLHTEKAERLSYAAAFEKYLNLDPHSVTTNTLKEKALAAGLINTEEDAADRDLYLNFLLGKFIEPNFGKTRPTFLYDFPASQAALARILPTQPAVAARFEVYYQGLELANGFYELSDAKEQRARFEQDLEKRKNLNLPILPLDENLLAALEKGLPACAGVAVGLDRLMMVALRAKNIEEVMSFI
jgi:elongation factor P--(R)-beta-lysine ligase